MLIERGKKYVFSHSLLCPNPKVHIILKYSGGRTASSPLGFSKTSAFSYLLSQALQKIYSYSIPSNVLIKMSLDFLKRSIRTFLVVHQLRLHASNAGGTCYIPGKGTKILHAKWYGQEKKKKKGLSIKL